MYRHRCVFAVSAAIATNQVKKYLAATLRLELRCTLCTHNKNTACIVQTVFIVQKNDTLKAVT